MKILRLSLIRFVSKNVERNIDESKLTSKLRYFELRSGTKINIITIPANPKKAVNLKIMLIPKL